MNKVFLIGKIVSKIQYDFIVRDKRFYSITRFKVNTMSESIVNICGYNLIADYCYINLDNGSKVYIQGNLNSKLECEIEKVYII